QQGQQPGRLERPGHCTLSERVEGRAAKRRASLPFNQHVGRQPDLAMAHDGDCHHADLLLPVRGASGSLSWVKSEIATCALPAVGTSTPRENDTGGEEALYGSPASQ